jgi:hypothetical protein
MLDPDRVLKYGLKTIYLVNCSSQGNFYATTDSAQRIHGAVYCHQLADVIATIQAICNEDQVVIIGANECYDDDVLMVRNGPAATALDGWTKINFKSMQNSLLSGKRNTVGKHNNNVISHGYSVSGKVRIEDENGLHPPQIKCNTKNNPVVGSQFVALSKVITDADPAEKFFRRSGNIYDSRKKYANNILVQSGYVHDDGDTNVIEGNSYVANVLLLKKIRQTKMNVPLDGHIDKYNSDMDGFSSFCGVSKTTISNSGEIVRVGVVGYNRAAVDHVTLQRVVRQTVLHQVGHVADSMFPPDRRIVFPHVPRMLNEHDAEDGLFAVPSHINISVFESLLCTGVMDVQSKHGHATPLAAEIASSVPFMNGTDKAYDAFTHIASLDELPSVNMTKYYVDWNNATTGSNFSTGRFQRHRPPCQKPIPLPHIIFNNLVLFRIVKAANENGMVFEDALKIMKKHIHGADSLVAGRILRMLSLTGNIVSNRYAVGAEIPTQLAKRVRVVASVSKLLFEHHFLLRIVVAYLLSFTATVPRAMAT